MYTEREKLPQYALLFNNSTPSLYVGVNGSKTGLKMDMMKQNAGREKW